jgi:plastocyanin
MKMRRLGFVLTYLVLVAWVSTACSSSSPGPSDPPEPVSYTIEMTEYAFSPDRIELKVGQEVTLELVNLGLISHELMIGQDVARSNNRPSGFHKDLFEIAHVEPVVVGGSEAGEHSADGHGADHAGSFMVVLPEKGDQARLTFQVTEDMVGEWELGCFEQEGVHYDAGMKGMLVVLP